MDVMKEIMYNLYKNKKSNITKKDINECKELPSYNTILLKYGFTLSNLNKEFRERYYNENPTLCLMCHNSIPFCKGIEVKKFCNQSCAASYNNKGYNRHTGEMVKDQYCLSCNTFIPKGKTDRKYCDLKCHKQHQYDTYVKSWLAGDKLGFTGKTCQISNYVRRYLHETRGTACEDCGWDERHPVDGSVLTEVEHIDGDATNNDLSNLKILCPNCHSMTPTFRARNKNSARNRK